MNNCRSKRMLKLVLGSEYNSKSHIITKKEPIPKKIRCETESSEVYEFVDNNDEDPWKEFNKWKIKEIESYNSWKLQQQKNSKSNHSHCSTNFISSSSLSWEPEKEDLDSSSTSRSSEYLKEIPLQEHIINKPELTQENDICHFAENSKDYNLANVDTRVLEQKISSGINEFSSKNSAQNSTSISPEARSNITILQNITVPSFVKPIRTNRNQNEGILTQPPRDNLINPNTGLICGSTKTVEVTNRKSRIWDKKDRCIYCNQDITNFSRHIFRNHQEQDSVRKILQLPKGDKTRKEMINLLRKEGNLALVDEDKIRPVQRTRKTYGENPKDNQMVNEFMPCPYCKGIYRLKTLRKHSNKCSYNPQIEKSNIASLGQNLLIFKSSRKSFLDTLRLKNEVFSKMHADRASFNGKNDPVVCQYAEDYLRKHKRPHIRHAVSNKVRELGRLLVPLQDIYGIKTMLEAMNTVHYDKVVHAAQIISGYDTSLKTFKAPSLAMHLKTILLGACLAAKTLLLKQNPILSITNFAESLKSVKQFRLLVDERWKYDMGSLALKDLNEKHGNKPQTLPITSDVIKFRTYAVNNAEESMATLKENSQDKVHFRKLTEAALVLTIVMNRKRVGDVQYIKLDSYRQTTASINQEECLNVLTESEKLLSAHFKRIITIGKGSRSIPILFPKNVQSYVDALLSAREKNDLIPPENPFLFALLGSKENWVDGSSVLRKYAEKCGAANPKTLTSSRLRKQIATVLQVINLNDTEKEQVASFMGHTKKTHEEFYRLPQEVYQTAKIAKLLLMMDKGEGAEFQGKTLEEIDIHLENFTEEKSKIKSNNESDDEESVSEELLENKTVNNGSSCKEESNNTENLLCSEYNEIEDLRKPNTKGTNIRNKQRNAKEGGVRGTWNNEQKTIMKKFFKKHIKNKISPKKHECLELKKQNNQIFENKTWVQIKVFIYNEFREK